MSRANGNLILAATPIGDVSDASAALSQTLLDANIIAAEDTRRAYSLFSRLDIAPSASVVSYFEANESQRTPFLVEQMLKGLRVVLITDAGMPSVSDPGYRLVNAAIDNDLVVSALPGPSAVLTALAVSGLPCDRFCFEGFLPKKQGERTHRLEDLADEKRTMVFFESPRRLSQTLTDMASVFGAERKAVVCRELTKIYEETKRGTLAQLAQWAAQEVLGEITVVVAGVKERRLSPEQALVEVNELIAQGNKLSAAVGQVAANSGFNRKQLYDLALANRKADDGK